MLSTTKIVTDHLHSSRHTGFRKQCRDWLAKFAKECYNIQLHSHAWISDNIAPLPALKKTKEQVYQPQENQVDIGTLQDQSFPTTKYVESGKDPTEISPSQEEALLRSPTSSLDLDFGKDPSIYLGSPIPEPSIAEEASAPACEELSPEDPLPSLPSPSSRILPESSARVAFPSEDQPRSPKLRASPRRPAKSSSSSRRSTPPRRPLVPVRRDTTFPSQEPSRSKRPRSSDPTRTVTIPVEDELDFAVSISSVSVPMSLGKRKHPEVSPSLTKRQQFQRLQEVTSSRSSEGRNQERSIRRRRNMVCVVPDCEEEGVSYRKRHAYAHHIPTIFSDTLVATDHRVVNMRIRALLQATTWLLGRPGTLQDLQKFVDRQGLLDDTSNSWEITPEFQTLMEAICLELKLSKPRHLTFVPLNHVALLLHWHVLYYVSALLRPDHRQMWLEDFAITEDLPRIQAPSAVDSHFHLDRLRKSIHMKHAPVEDVLAFQPISPDRNVNLIAVVANFCDPDTYPSDVELLQLPSDVRVCLGIHPKHARLGESWIQRSISKMSALLSHPRVSGIGEIGLDHSVSTSQWDQQAQLLTKILPLVSRKHVLVIHCRGKSGDDGLEAHWLLLHLLKKEKISSRQRIHLHSFNGNSLTLQCWLTAFPETHFSFNRGVETFNDDQRAALSSIKEERLLLETDAPYFPARGKTYSSPSELFDIASLVASVRKMKTKDLLAITAQNALRLYDA